jgi:hypothetical protein
MMQLASRMRRCSRAGGDSGILVSSVKHKYTATTARMGKSIQEGQEHPRGAAQFTDDDQDMQYAGHGGDRYQPG